MWATFLCMALKIQKEKLNGISQIKYKTAASAENHDSEQKQ